MDLGIPENKPKNKIGIKDLIRKNKTFFFIDFVIVLLITFSVLYLFGLVPEEFKSTIGRDPAKESAGKEVGELPLSIKIPVIGVDTDVYNPQSTSTQILDDLLLKGTVRYPGSGLPGGKGNVFIFGHSTGLKVVHNQAFKAFNGLKNLKEGDLIYVISEKNQYTYRVLKVEMKTAADALVVFDTKSNLLTLSTCNTFGQKEDRYIAVAEFVSKVVIPTNGTQ